MGRQIEKCEAENERVEQCGWSRLVRLPFCIRWLNIEGDDRVVSLIPWVEGGAGSSRAPIAMPPLAV